MAATNSAFETEEEARINAAVKALDAQITRNEYLLAHNLPDEVDYVVDMMRITFKSSILSTEKETALNQQLRQQTDISYYVLVSLPSVESLDQDGEVKTKSPAELQERSKRFTTAVAQRSKLHEKGKRGVLINFDSRLEWVPGKKNNVLVSTWVAFGSEVAEDAIRKGVVELNANKDEYKRAGFDNYAQAYVDGTIAILNKTFSNPADFRGKGESDKDFVLAKSEYQALAAALAGKPDFTGRITKQVLDYAAVLSPQDIQQFLSKYPDLQVKLFTTSANRIPTTGKTAIQMALEGQYVEGNAVHFGLHFTQDDKYIYLRLTVVVGAEHINAHKQELIDLYLTPILTKQGNLTFAEQFAAATERILTLCSTWGKIKTGYDQLKQDFRIPETWWNHDDSDKRLIHPFLAGFLDGCFEQLTGIPDLVMLVADGDKREQLSTAISTLWNDSTARQKLWVAVILEVGDYSMSAMTGRFSVKQYYQMGKVIPGIAALMAGVGLAKNLGKVGKFAELLDAVGDIGRLLGPAARVLVASTDVLNKAGFVLKRLRTGVYQLLDDAGRAMADLEANLGLTLNPAYVLQGIDGKQYQVLTKPLVDARGRGWLLIQGADKNGKKVVGFVAAKADEATAMFESIRKRLDDYLPTQGLDPKKLLADAFEVSGDAIKPAENSWADLGDAALSTAKKYNLPSGIKVLDTEGNDITKYVKLLADADGTIKFAYSKTNPENWFQRMLQGQTFNKARRAFIEAQDGGYVEVYVNNTTGKGLGDYLRLDGYVEGVAIYSRKFTQLSEIQPETALAYLKEFVEKYKPGTPIPPVKSNEALLARLAAKGKKPQLEGQMILEVPVQTNWQPEKMRQVLEYARDNGIDIIDVSGKIYK